MGTLANCEDPDLHHLLKFKPPSGTEIHCNLEISSYDPLNYIMYNTYYKYQYVWENPSEYKRVD